MKPKPIPARRGGFTLVELLVVIGIIALLIGILLPTLGRARDAAKTIACLSNQRQIGQGMIFYINDWDGALPAHEVLNQPRGTAGRFWAWKLSEPGYVPLGETADPATVNVDSVYMCPDGEPQRNPNPFTFPKTQIDRQGAMYFEFEVPGPNYDADPNSLRHVAINYATNGSWADNVAYWSAAAGSNEGYGDWFPINYVNVDKSPNAAFRRNTWTKVTRIEDSTKVGLIFDGPYILGQNIYMMNMRHRGQEALNWVFADGHAKTVAQDEVPNDDPRSANYWGNLLPGEPNANPVFFQIGLLNSNQFGVKFTIKPIYNPY